MMLLKGSNLQKFVSERYILQRKSVPRYVFSLIKSIFTIQVKFIF